MISELVFLAAIWASVFVVIKGLCGIAGRFTK